MYAENPSIKDFRVYGIDRIDDLKVIEEDFKPKNGINILQRFEDLIGVTNPVEGQGKQSIILSFDKEQGLYFKSFPWHKSFDIISGLKQKLV